MPGAAAAAAAAPIDPICAPSCSPHGAAAATACREVVARVRGGIGGRLPTQNGEDAS